MAKKSFLVPLAVTLSAIVGASTAHASLPTATSQDSKAAEVSVIDGNILGDLILERAVPAANAADSFAGHVSHSSHVSHASHSSHASHESHSSHYSSYY